MENKGTFIPDELDTRHSSVLTEPMEVEVNFTGWTHTGQSLSSIIANIVNQLNTESKYEKFLDVE